MRRTSLAGVWKVSASLRGRSAALLPKRIRFEENINSSNKPARLLAAPTTVDSGGCSIPYTEHCGGHWEVGDAESADESGALPAGFVVACAEKEGAPASRLSFEGLYDGERIAGTVSDASGDEVADFLCTRLFTFWGTPKVAAASNLDDGGESSGGNSSAAHERNGEHTGRLRRLHPLDITTQGAEEPSSARPIPRHARSHGSSHPKPLRVPAGTPGQPRGFRWLDAGITNTVVETRKGPKLHPGVHGLDLRDWLMLNEPTRKAQMEMRKKRLADPKERPQVLQADDPSTYGAQCEVLEMISSHLLWGESALGGASSGDSLSHVPEWTMEAAAAWAASQPGQPEHGLEPPLETAAKLIQEDLVLMRHDPTFVAASSSDNNGGSSGEYRAVAGAVFFSFGDLLNRFGSQYSMAQLHEKVGNYDSHLHAPVTRLLDGLTPDRPGWRANWSFSFTSSLEPVPDRYLTNLEKRKRIFPDAPVTEWDGPDGALRRFDRDGVGETLHVKVEYQTLRRLTVHSDYVLFAIHTYLEPLSSLETMPKAAAALSTNVRRACELDFRHYKGLGDERIASRLLEYLDGLG